MKNQLESIAQSWDERRLEWKRRLRDDDVSDTERATLLHSIRLAESEARTMRKRADALRCD